jgi:FixJ family two-component response regulator
MDHLTMLPQPPYLIVTSRLADDDLWAEALNIGAFDVLAKPLGRTEVTRVLSSAWQHWQRQYCVPTMSRKVMLTAAAAAA